MNENGPREHVKGLQGEPLYLMLFLVYLRGWRLAVCRIFPWQVPHLEALLPIEGEQIGRSEIQRCVVVKFFLVE